MSFYGREVASMPTCSAGMVNKSTSDLSTHPTSTGLTRQSYKDALFHGTVDNKLHKCQQQTISSLSQELQLSSDITAQLTSALQAESSKGAALQQSLVALQCELDITNSARQLATDEVDQLGAQLEDLQALAIQQDKTVQQQEDQIKSLEQQVEALHHSQEFLKKRLAWEAKNNHNLTIALQESQAKLGAAQLSKAQTSRQLILVRSSSHNSPAMSATSTASDPWKDLLIVLLMLVVFVVPGVVPLLLVSALLLFGVFALGVVILAHTAELFQAGVVCWDASCSATTAGVTFVVETWGCMKSCMQQLDTSGYQNFVSFKSSVQQHVAACLKSAKAWRVVSRDTDVVNLVSNNSAQLLPGFKHCDSLPGLSFGERQVSVAGSSRSSLSADVCDGTDDDSIQYDSDVIAVVSLKGLMMASKA